jgi:hypothetical protein
MPTYLVVYFQGVWPADLGGEAFSPRRKLSQAWWDKLREDNPTMYMDQDVYDADQVGRMSIK